MFLLCMNKIFSINQFQQFIFAFRSILLMYTTQLLAWLAIFKA